MRSRHELWDLLYLLFVCKQAKLLQTSHAKEIAICLGRRRSLCTFYCPLIRLISFIEQGVPSSRLCCPGQQNYNYKTPSTYLVISSSLTWIEEAPGKGPYIWTNKCPLQIWYKKCPFPCIPNSFCSLFESQSIYEQHIALLKRSQWIEWCIFTCILKDFLGMHLDLP